MAASGAEDRGASKRTPRRRASLKVESAFSAATRAGLRSASAIPVPAPWWGARRPTERHCSLIVDNGERGLDVRRCARAWLPRSSRSPAELCSAVTELYRGNLVMATFAGFVLTHPLLSCLGIPYSYTTMGAQTSKPYTGSSQTLGGPAPTARAPDRPAPAVAPKAPVEKRLAALTPSVAHADGVRPGSRTAAAAAAERRQQEVSYTHPPLPASPFFISARAIRWGLIVYPCPLIAITPSARTGPTLLFVHTASQAQNRGTSTTNPNQGRLAAQVAANKSAKPVPGAKQEDKLVVRAPWIYRSAW